MSEYSLDLKAATREEAILGFMRYAQTCHGVESFPLFPDPRWAVFLYAVDEEFGDTLFQDTASAVRNYDDILFALEVTTIIDREACRMRLDVEESKWGRQLGLRFPDIAERMFMISQEIRGFAEVGS